MPLGEGQKRTNEYNDFEIDLDMLNGPAYEQNSYSEYEEYDDDDYERNAYSYERTQKARQRQLLQRKRKAQRRRRVLISYIVILMVILCAVVFIFKKTVDHFKAERGNDKVALKLDSIGDDEGNLSGDTESDSSKQLAYLNDAPDEDEIPEAPKYLGYNESLQTQTVNVHGMNIFSGYEISKTDSTYYITSENMMSTYAILVDAADGHVVCQRDGFVRINPASMTKILTVLVAAEHLTEEDLDQKVTITVADTDYAFSKGLSAVNFNIGETVTVRDLFYGTILPSGADAAVALAGYVAGDEQTFVAMMNERIKELGISDTTHFTNCVGMYDPDHYSTCADMAVILKAAIENDYVYEVMNAHTYTTSLTDEHPEGILISNWFLRRIEDKDTNGEVLCAKTGFVNESGSCAASYEVTNSDHPYICVTADAHSSWRCIYDHVDLYANCTE